MALEKKMCVPEFYECPECLFPAKMADTTACHLIDAHAWSYARACDWLREQVEKAA